MTIETQSFGCRLNRVESDVAQAKAQEAGLRDALIVNTCAVTAESVRQARQAIRRARREAPERQIIVTGCAAQTEPQTFAEMNEVDLVLGNEEKLRADSYRPAMFGLDDEERVQVNDIMSVRETAAHMVDGLTDRARAFVQIQNGCDHRCTFCIIPFGRGNSRSVPAGAVVEQIRRTVDNGYKEVVLTGVDITAYGADLPGDWSLGRLTQAILKQVPALQRLRLSSIDSIEVDDALMQAIAEEERLMPHFHLSLQAGNDLILKRMKRRHLRGDSIRFCEQIRELRPDAVFGADIIAGFPTETEAMFQDSIDIVTACELVHLHVFPFSPRPGTPAARMPQVAREDVKQRAARLRAAGQGQYARHLSAETGATRQVLVETPTRGRTEYYTPVTLEGAEPGSIVTVQIAGHDGAQLLGQAS